MQEANGKWLFVTPRWIPAENDRAANFHLHEKSRDSHNWSQDISADETVNTKSKPLSPVKAT